MDDNIKGKYRHQIQESEIFLSSSSRAAARKQWTSLQQNKWLMRQEMCPTCDIQLNSQNLTKEHIHPLCIGGAERDDNVIAMCHECNEARNNTMTAVLGGNNPKSLRDRWPANRSSVEEFVVWCHATVYGDFETVRKLKHIEEAFIKWRGLKSSKFLTKRISSKETKKSIFKSALFKTKSMLSNTKNVLSKPSSKVKIDCENCGKTLQLPKGYNGRFKCPSCSHIAGESPEVNIETKSAQESNSKKSLPKAKEKTKIFTSNSQSKSSLKDSLRKYILEDLSISGNREIGYYGIMNQDGSFGSNSKFSKFSEIKVAMGYPLNKKLRDIVSDLCGASVRFTSEQIGDTPVVYVELATEPNDESEQIVQDSSRTKDDPLFNLKTDLWNQIEHIILTNERTFAELDYLWRQVSFWSKTVGFSGVIELKKELGYSSKAKVVDLITELYGDKLQITKVGEKIQLLLETND